MTRIDLSVPFAEKDKAKALGAKWDTVNKVWYVPDGLDSAPFQKWLHASPDASSPQPITPNVRCNRFFTASGVEKCWKCSAPVKMVAFVLPRGWEEWTEVEENDEIVDRWVMQEVDIMLNYISYINEAALAAAHQITHGYKLVLQQGHKTKKYLNYCETCGVAQIEPNSGNTHIFKPDMVEQAERLTLHYHNQPFEARSGFQSTLRCHGGYNAFDFMALSSGQ